MPDKILFLKWKDFSLINDSIYKILHDEFPDMDIDVIDVYDIWRKKVGNRSVFKCVALYQ